MGPPIVIDLASDDDEDIHSISFANTSIKCSLGDGSELADRPLQSCEVSNSSHTTVRKNPLDLAASTAYIRRPEIVSTTAQSSTHAQPIAKKIIISSKRCSTPIVMVVDESIRSYNPSLVAGIRNTFTDFPASCQQHIIGRWPDPMNVMPNENSNSNASAKSNNVSDVVSYNFCEVGALGKNIIQWSHKPPLDTLYTMQDENYSALDWRLKFDTVGYEPFRLYVAENTPFLQMMLRSRDGVVFDELVAFLNTRLFVDVAVTSGGGGDGVGGIVRNGDEDCDRLRYILVLMDVDKDVLRMQQQVCQFFSFAYRY